MLYVRDEVEKRIREDYGVFLLDDFIKRLEDHHKRTYKYNSEYGKLLMAVLSDVSDRSDVSHYGWWMRNVGIVKRRYNTSPYWGVKNRCTSAICVVDFATLFWGGSYCGIARGWRGCVWEFASLVSNCHAKKTRANVLKNDKLFEKHFGARSSEMVSELLIISNVSSVLNILEYKTSFSFFKMDLFKTRIESCCSDILPGHPFSRLVPM